MIDRGPAEVPKREVVKDRVLELIESLQVGDALPPERQLSASLGVSRMTLRHAVDELVRQGYLVRRHGSGTFVAEPKIAQPLTITSFSEDMRRRGMTPSSITLSEEDVHAGMRLGRRLGIPPDESVRKVVRLRLANNETMAIETLHFPRSLAPDLTGADLEAASFYEILQHRYGLEIGSGAQTIEPTVIDEDESDALGVPPGTPAFLFERTTLSSTGRTIEFVRSIYRGDRYKLIAELQPPALKRSRKTAETEPT